MRQQPGGCAIEEDARPLGAGPTQGIEPPTQSETDPRVGPLAEAVSQPDLRRVLPALVRAAIARQLIEIRHLQLSDEGLEHRIGYRQRVFEEGAEKAGGSELQRKAQPVVVATLGADSGVISIVQMEKAR